MKRLVFLLLISMFILVACAGEDDEDTNGGLEGVSNDNTPTTINDNVADAPRLDDELVINDSLVANISSPEANIFEMPDIEGLDGQLLFVQGNASSVAPNDGDSGRIFLANFDGSQPQMLATRVYTTSVSLSPDKKHVFYTGVSGRSWYTHLLNLDTLETTQLTQLQSRFGTATGWSPDGQWLTFVNPGGANQILIRVDGSARLDLGNGVVFWTHDNQIIFINFQFNTDTQTTETEAQVIDPLTQELTVLDFAIDFNDPSGGIIFAELLAEEGHILASNYWTAGQNGTVMLLPDEENYLNVQSLTPGNTVTNAAALCGQFQMSEHTPANPAGEVFYDVTDTLTITDIQLHDGGYFLERWYLDNCDFDLENLHISLEYVKLGEDTQVITEDVYPGVDVNPSFMRANNGVRYTTSADGRYIIWIEGTYATLTTTLKMTDLVTNETADLMIWTSSSTNNFVIFDAFTAVFLVD